MTYPNIPPSPTSKPANKIFVQAAVVIIIVLSIICGVGIFNFFQDKAKDDQRLEAKNIPGSFVKISDEEAYYVNPDKTLVPLTCSFGEPPFSSPGEKTTVTDCNDTNLSVFVTYEDTVRAEVRHRYRRGLGYDMHGLQLKYFMMTVNSNSLNVKCDLLKEHADHSRHIAMVCSP